MSRTALSKTGRFLYMQAAKAEERAQSALAAESHGDMKVASVFWGDSWSYDQKAKNFSAEALRYEAMLKPPKTAPKPKIKSPGTASNVTAPTVTAEKKEIAPAIAEPAAEPTLQELVAAYSAERAAILETADKRHALEWGNAALKDQQVWQYIQHSGADPDLDGLAMLMDAALAEYRTPTQSARMDYAKKTANQIVMGNAADSLKHLFMTVGADIAGDYVQTAATGINFLGQFPSSTGYQEQAEITLRQLQEERDAYVQGGIPEDNILVIQLDKEIMQYAEELEYIQSGERDADREKARQKYYAKAFELKDMAEEAATKLKNGAGTVGDFLVDYGIEGCNELVNCAVDKLGGRKIGLANRLIRGFGKGAYKAACDGKSPNEQILYGLMTATVTRTVEKVDLKQKDYSSIVRTVFRGASGALRTNSHIIEIIGSLSLNALGDALATMAVDVVDPCLDLIMTGKPDVEEVRALWNEGMSTYIASIFESVVKPG